MTTIPRLEYRDLELPKVEERRPAGSGLRTTWIVAALALLVAAWALLSGALNRGLVFAKGQAGDGTSSPTPLDPSRLLVHTVQPIDLRITAQATGAVQSRSSADVRSEVEGEIGILSVVPVGTRVAAGDIVVELDSAPLRAREADQQILVENTRAEVSQLQQSNLIAKSEADGKIAAAKLALEFARLDLEKYEKSDYPLELRQLQIETALAQEALERAKVDLQFSEDLAKDHYIHQGELEADRSRVTQAGFKLENARGKERSLQDYTYPRTKRDKESKVQEAERSLAQAETQARIAAEQAETSLKAKTKTLDLEEAKLVRIQDQLGKCTVRAPLAGIVVYPVPPDTDMVEDFISAGNKVKQRKHLFSIPDSDVLQVAASLHEALVNRVKPGQTGRITVEVVEAELQGTVQWISPTPDPEDWRRTAVKYYETKVSIDHPAEGLRPGMTAQVEILIEERPNVLAVPVQSVVQHASKTKGVCYVAAAGGLELRHLRLGKNSAEFIEVLEGLTAGERVVLSPDVIGIPADAFEDPAAPSSGAQASTPVAATDTDGTDTPAEPGAADPSVPVAPAVQEFEYEAALSGAPVTKAEAEFKIKVKEGATTYKFQAEIEGGTPGATYEITVDGVKVGSVTLDELGNCALELSTKFGNFPVDFPIGAGPGSSVEVGPDLKGTLELQVN